MKEAGRQTLPQIDAALEVHGGRRSGDGVKAILEDQPINLIR